MLFDILMVRLHQERYRLSGHCYLDVSCNSPVRARKVVLFQQVSVLNNFQKLHRDFDVADGHDSLCRKLRGHCRTSQPDNTDATQQQHGG